MLKKQLPVRATKRRRVDLQEMASTIIHSSTVDDLEVKLKAQHSLEKSLFSKLITFCLVVALKQQHSNFVDILMESYSDHIDYSYRDSEGANLTDICLAQASDSLGDVEYGLVNRGAPLPVVIEDAHQSLVAAYLYLIHDLFKRWNVCKQLDLPFSNAQVFVDSLDVDLEQEETDIGAPFLVAVADQNEILFSVLIDHYRKQGMLASEINKVGVIDGRSTRPLLVSVELLNMSLVKLCLDHGASLNISNEQGVLPLSASVVKGGDDASLNNRRLSLNIFGLLWNHLQSNVGYEAYNYVQLDFLIGLYDRQDIKDYLSSLLKYDPMDFRVPDVGLVS